MDAHFAADIRAAPSGAWFAHLPPQAAAAFGALPVAVHATVGGVATESILHQAYDGTVAIILDVALRERLRLAVGGKVDVVMQPRPRAMPPDLARAVRALPAAALAWAHMDAVPRTRMVAWVEGSRRPDERAFRIVRILGMLIPNPAAPPARLAAVARPA